MKSLYASFACLALFVAPHLRAQEPDGTAQISGRVIASETGAPIAHATVTATLQPANSKPRTTVTDADGNYQIGWLPPGNFKVTAVADGFVLRTFERQPDTSAAALTLLPVPDTASLSSIDFRLDSAGSLHGTIVDDTGTPVGEGVPVAAVQTQGTASDKSFLVRSTAATDPHGVFTLKHLAPGVYLVCAEGPNGTLPSKTHITYRETWLGDAATPDQAQTAEVHAGDPGPELRIIAPRIATYTLTVIPQWSAPLESADTSAIHFTLALNRAGTPFEPTPTQRFLDLSPGRYNLTVTAYRGDDVAGQASTRIDITNADKSVTVKVSPTIN